MKKNRICRQKLTKDNSRKVREKMMTDLLPQVEEDVVDIATQKGQDTDADSEHGAEAEAGAVLVVEHGERHLAVAAPVALAAVACVAGRRVSHAGAVATWAAGTQRVDADFSQGALFGQMACRAPVQGRDGGVRQRQETLGKLSDKREAEIYRVMKPTLTV